MGSVGKAEKKKNGEGRLCVHWMDGDPQAPVWGEGAGDLIQKRFDNSPEACPSALQVR